MYTPGKLLFFDPFYFQNSNSHAPKFLLVLKAVDDNVILASLPSSQKHLPSLQEIKHGCLEIPDACINCYIFEAKKPITKCGWSFDLDTMLYGNWIDDYSVDNLLQKYPIQGVDFDIIGELIDEELSAVIECFKNSRTVKRKYKKLL